MYCKKILIENQKIKKLFDDYVVYLILGIIIGGRLGYVFIYNPFYFLQNFHEIPMLWNGGMSFHGGLIGVIFATILYCKKNDQEVFYFLDLVCAASPIGIFFGRIANFINSELYGRETDIFWSVKFVLVDNINRHPSQIYEAIFEGIILFLIINIFYKKLFHKTGIISSLFVILYSIFRFIIEFTREPDAHLGLLAFNLSMGQYVSLIFIMGGLILFYSRNDFKK
tara:strand:- start:86 stop:760 length:675 start_codon:yes stop_codon:yes gene_type:complete